MCDIDITIYVLFSKGAEREGEKASSQECSYEADMRGQWVRRRQRWQYTGKALAHQKVRGQESHAHETQQWCSVQAWREDESALESVSGEGEIPSWWQTSETEHR